MIKTNWIERKGEYIKDGYKTIVENKLAADIYRSLILEGNNPETYANPKNLKTRKKAKYQKHPTPQVKTYFAAWNELGYLIRTKRKINTKRRNKFTTVYLANFNPFFDFLKGEFGFKNEEIEFIKSMPPHDLSERVIESVRDSKLHVFQICLDWLYYAFYENIKRSHDWENNQKVIGIFRKHFPLQAYALNAYNEERKRNFTIVENIAKAKLTKKQIDTIFPLSSQ